MRAKVIFFSACAGTLAACLGALTLAWLLPRTDSVIGAERSAVAFVRAHTPMKRVQNVQWYTGGPLEITVTGRTYNGQLMYAFVENGRATIAYGDQVVSARRAIAAARRLGYPVAGIVSAVPGWIDPAYTTVFGSRARSDAVWEVTEKLKNGHYLFAYIDMYTGDMLWHFTTNASFHPWQE